MFNEVENKSFRRKKTERSTWTQTEFQRNRSESINSMCIFKKQHNFNRFVYKCTQSAHYSHA